MDKQEHQSAGCRTAEGHVGPPEAAATTPAASTAAPAHTAQVPDDSNCLDDITTIDLRKQYLVENPAQPESFLQLKARTPARIGVGRAGARYRTITQLRVRADHAAAQDSVFSDVPACSDCP